MRGKLTRDTDDAGRDRDVPPGPVPRRSSLAWYLGPFAVFAALGILWALASPIFSVPDENAHATKAIAQVRGQVIGDTVPGVRHIVVDLPSGYEYSEEILCFKWHPERSASCDAELGDSGGQDWFNTWVGAYNPVYYAMVGWPSLFFDGSAGVYAMRFASALLCAALLAWAFHSAVLGPRARWLPFGVAFVAAPMNVYLMGSVNPNGAELASAVALWVGVLRLFESHRMPSVGSSLSRTWLWAGVSVAAVVLVNARALGPLWLVIIVAACAAVAGWQQVKALFSTPTSYWWLGAIAVGGLFSVGWTLWGGSLSGQAEASDAPLVGAGFTQGVLYVLRSTGDYLQQAVGIFGWLDTALPAWSYWPIVAAFAVLVVLGVTAVPRRGVLVLVSVMAATVIVPALVQGYSVSQTGIIWQGRYVLFLSLGVMIVASWFLSHEAPRAEFLSRRVSWVGAALIAAYGVIAFALVLVRYVIGGAAPLESMLTSPQWQPPLGWAALTAGYLVVSACVVGMVGAAATVLDREDRTDARTDSDARLGTGTASGG